MGMEEIIYSLLKEKKTADLIGKIKSKEIPVTFVDSKSVSLYMLSLYFRNKELTGFLSDHLSSFSVYEAAAGGQLEALKSNLENDSLLLDSFSPDGFTPLGLACYFGQIGIATYLLEKGADPNIPSNNPFKVSPLHSAVAAKRYDIAKLLLKYKAEVNAVQQNNVTPLHSAAHHGDIEMAKLLINNGADKTKRMDDGSTPLDMALKVGVIELNNLLS